MGKEGKLDSAHVNDMQGVGGVLGFTQVYRDITKLPKGYLPLCLL